MKQTLVVATHSQGKVVELRALLARVAVRVVSVDEVVRTPPIVIEDGRTFAENAVKKARAVAEATLTLTLADDSGLEVDALEGRPGVRSARFSSERATDAENNAALLAALEAAGDPHIGRSAEDHAARFRCALALVDPYTRGGEPFVVEGVCEGAITRAPRGTGGFGYDPLFVVAGLDKTMAELSEREKNVISHRARAFAALLPALEELLRERGEAAERISRG